ncbi:MAG: phosphate acyltransferase PlsX [Candidatus Cloacimonetes bacterium]|nr:phosphate acyltransferase PlsX [Candidatus Cloacimonadota bacterium]MDY0336676.1 phosphate acyltransferase PlsX [Candidatus Cloacimonadaceae bacterium]MCB5269458.1 phosphate acyltransferase PlsX [Candidatus Cloacimonadota bacterium]MCK9333765.1 phosphate acyltransferase PlsX [Candidatus Cloacimonadota bacterium]MDD2543454.1 phosphate acyltransferase PlsX [Candidatus Cloacimonadota bacterium]
MRVALDAFGSDAAPFPEIEGAVLAIKEDLCSEVILVGNQEVIAAELSKYYYDSSRIKIENASERIEMGDSAASSVRSKRDSSMVRAIALHKEGKADVAISAGNTGAMMSASLLTLGRMKNVLRPAIAVVFPTQQGHEIILDVGANVDCEAQHLLQFAVLGSKYFEYFFKEPRPRISLLNIGEESAKGNSMSKEAHQLMASSPDINFVGNIEGKDVISGVTDVIVCDGFVGNVMLKTVEGVGFSIFSILKEQINKDWVAKIGAILSYPVYSYIKKKLDHTEYGGALLVGLNGISVVSHGRSNAKAIKNAIRFGARIAESGFVKHTQEYFERL